MTQHIDADEALRLAQHEAEQQVLADDVAERAEAEETGKRLGDLEREIDRLKRQTVDGAVVERVFVSDGEGGISGVIDGRYGIQVKDHAQPTPTKPVMEDHSELGVVEVRWDGNVLPGTGEKPRGSKFGRVQTRHRLIEGGVQPDPEGPNWREGGAIGSYHGGTTIVSLGQPGQHAIWFYMAGPNNLEKSDFSEPLIVDVEPLVDRDEIQEWIDDKATELEEYIHDFGNRGGEQPPSADDKAPAGVIYYQKNPAGQVLGIWQSQGDGEWIGLPLNSAVLVSVTTDKLVAGESLIDGVLIKDGAITLEKITVTKELVAELGKFLTVEADMIAANAIDGMTITGGTLIGGEVRGGILRIGSGAQATVIDGINNRFAGRITTTGSNGSMVEIDTNFSGMAGIRLNTGSNADSEPTLLAPNKEYFYGEGSVTLSGRQAVMNQSNRADLSLLSDGNWQLQRGSGDAAGLVGVRQRAWTLDVRGRASSDSYTSQIVGGVTGVVETGNTTGALFWIYYPAAPPNGSRTPIITPSYRHSSASYWAKVGVHRVNTNNALVGLGDHTGGQSWRMHWLARWE